MNRILKCLTLILALLLVFCAFAESTSDTASADPAGALTEFLQTLPDAVGPGAAGCSLRATACAVKLIEWGETATLSESEITEVVTETVSAMDTGMRSEFDESFALVADLCNALVSEDGEALLEDAGIAVDDMPAVGDLSPAVRLVIDTIGTL